jgi:hypothetical protein
MHKEREFARLSLVRDGMTILLQYMTYSIEDIMGQLSWAVQFIVVDATVGFQSFTYLHIP